MKPPSIKARDMLQIQTKEIQYVSNIDKRFVKKDNVILIQPNENYPFVRRNGESFVLESLARTLSNNEVLVHYIEKIGSAIRKNTLLTSCLELTELIPTGYKEISIDTQIDDLLNLYSLYHCFLCLVWHIPITDPVISDHIKKTVFPVINDQEHLCWSFVSFVTIMLMDEKIKTILVTNPPIIREVLHIDSLYSALLYQLLMHIAAGEEGTKGSFAICESCGETFFRERKHKKYCTYCDRPSERTRACRAKKKEVPHAQEIHP